jgi:hypothetical protein
MATEEKTAVVGNIPQALKIIEGTTHYNNIKALVERFNLTLADIEGLEYSQAVERDVVKEEEEGFLFRCWRPVGRPVWDVTLKGGAVLSCYGD